MKKLLGTAALAGLVAAGFAVAAALFLRISAVIAGIVTGLLTALYVGYVIYRDDIRRPKSQ
jgi:O-antigen/teichoic acid export membrane protein